MGQIKVMLNIILQFWIFGVYCYIDESVARLPCALPLNLSKSMTLDLDLKVAQVGCDCTASNFRPISTNMQSINLIHQPVQEIYVDF